MMIEYGYGLAYRQPALETPDTTDDTAQIREDSFKVFLPYSDSSALDMEYQMDINLH